MRQKKVTSIDDVDPKSRPSILRMGQEYEYEKIAKMRVGDRYNLTSMPAPTRQPPVRTNPHFKPLDLKKPDHSKQAEPKTETSQEPTLPAGTEEPVGRLLP
mmetsp:Transcript_19865/g.30595  ORF Transcript_19865/g.30595 Transcript_19865/m.30595 type:complete len:101 (-) Transcript_19865:91-393(-)